MKKTVLLIGFCFAISLWGMAQNRSIQFEEEGIEWKKVLKKASKAKKYIFMDCYTSWCGPCKMLAKNVFTNDQVADYYNDRFVNVKYDMEKDEGVVLREKFGVRAFPTLLFIDPETGEVVHRLVGAGDVNHMLTQGKIAADRENNLAALKKRYEGGERNVEMLERYLRALAMGAMQKEQNQVAIDYLQALSLEELLKEENWKLLEANINDPLSVPLQKVFDNQSMFVKAFGAERVKNKLDKALQSGVAGFMNRGKEPLPNFDWERYNKILAFVSRVNSEAAPVVLLQLYAAGYAQEQKYAELLQCIKDGLKYNLAQGQMKIYFIMSNLTRFVPCQDKAIQKDVLALVDEQIAGMADPFRRASYFELKAVLLQAYGDAEGAAKAKEEAKVNAKEGEARSGGRVMRAMRMN